MKDYNTELFLGLASIIGLEMYEHNKTNNKKILKGGNEGVQAELARLRAEQQQEKDAAQAQKMLRQEKFGKAGAMGKTGMVFQDMGSSKMGKMGKAGAMKLGMEAKKAAEAAGKALSDGVDGLADYTKRNTNPSKVFKYGIIIGLIVFMIFMGGPTILIGAILFLSYRFLKIQIRRYFPMSKKKEKQEDKKTTNNNTSNF